MSKLYVSFAISEGIADRGEVDYSTWYQWIAEDYTYGPYDSIVCVYGTIEGFDAETGDRETIAHLINDPADPFDGYWRIVKREVYQRFVRDDARTYRAFLVGQPRSYSCIPDESLPPFSDWFVDADISAIPRAIREVDAYRARPGQLGS